MLVFNTQIHASEEAPFSLEEELSEEKFEALGLRKLSVNELSELSKWIENYKTSHHFDGNTTDSEDDYFLVSEIDGIFEGWSGSTIFRLKKAQKKATKNITSEVMNKAIPQRSPISVMELCTLRKVLSLIISLHHIKKVKSMRQKPTIKGHHIS